MEVQGIIKVLNEVQQISDKFRKREVVVTTADQYPQHILIQFAQDKCDLLNSVQVGQEVTISINLRGREWTSPNGEVKYFNTIEGWRINSANATTQPTTTDEGNLPF